MGDSRESLDPVYDVIVAGAGPAGAPAACYMKLFDACSQLRVLLVEKQSPDGYEKYHHKCGEGVDEEFLKEIAPITIVPGDITVHVTTAREHWGAGRVTETPTKECILNRPEFLRHVVDMYKLKGGEVRSDEVLRVVMSGKLVKVTCASGFTALARVVVGADGPNSRIRSCLGLPTPLIVTVMQYLIPNDPADDHTMTLWYSAKYKGGYKYIFPYGPGKAKLGFIKGTDEYHGPVFEMQAKQAAIGGIPSFVKGNVVLIGSAAAFTNPFTGGGIKAGFISARTLALHIVNAADGATGDVRIERMVTAIKKFEGWWKRSRYFSGKYMRAYEQFEVMDDAAILRLAKPFLVKGKVRKVIALLENITMWPIYRAFLDASKYS